MTPATGSSAPQHRVRFDVVEARSRRGSPEVFSYVGSGDEARMWLDTANGTNLRLTGPLGRVDHLRRTYGPVAFDRSKVDGGFAYDSDPMPVLVVVDVLAGVVEYTRGGRTDRVADGGSIVVAGRDMPFSGAADRPEVRMTTLAWELVDEAAGDLAPDQAGQPVVLTSYLPRSAAAGACWRAVVDQVETLLARGVDVEREDAAARLLAYTLLRTFASRVVPVGGPDEPPRDPTSTVRRALAIIERDALEELTLSELASRCDVSPRALQYAFRRHLGCTPQDHLRRVRLDLAGQALRDGSATSVADAAARFGFHNPGRFASDYRQLFDENPGRTLSRRTP